ncbi:hypothetical protein cypCar_00024663, partial [Cyprinus carpio]
MGQTSHLKNGYLRSRCITPSRTRSWNGQCTSHLAVNGVIQLDDGDELKKSLSELADKNHHSHTKSISRISSGSNPFLDIAHDPNAAVYKTGFLARKIHADMDGKK